LENHLTDPNTVRSVPLARENPAIGQREKSPAHEAVPGARRAWTGGGRSVIGRHLAHARGHTRCRGRGGFVVALKTTL
jgi:hypothetical protein